MAWRAKRAEGRPAGPAARLRPPGWLLIAIASLALPAAGLPAATRWLMAGEPPAASDMLVVLAGGSRERVQTGLELYRAGLAPMIMLTGPHGFPDAQMRFLEEQGVPPSALVPPLRPAGSTWEDALSVRQVAVRKRVHSLLVVTSPYHCRRARLILRRVLSGLGVRLTVTASVSLYMDASRWWRSRQGWISVPLELPKLVWAWATVPSLGDVGRAPPPGMAGTP